MSISNSSEKENSKDMWIKAAAVVVSLLTLVLNVQTYFSNEKLRKIELLQEEQKRLLEQQKLLLDKQSADFNFRLNLFDRAAASVKENNERQLKILLALVQSLPKSDYSDSLLNILTDSSVREIRQQAVDTLKSRFRGGAEWVYRPSNPSISGFTDYDIFICDSAISNSTADTLLTSVLESFNNIDRTGSIRVKKWESISEFSNQELSGKTTIITDKNHPEKSDAERIINAIKTKVQNLPPVNYQDNRGQSSPWRISIVLCP
jgi:hypothetical protein